MRLSLVVPCYNEQDNVVDFCKECVRVFSKGDFEYDFVFVNDGSTDKTLKTLKEIHDDHQFFAQFRQRSRDIRRAQKRKGRSCDRY